MTQTTVIIATYNQPRALSMALDGYARQTTRDFELIVADDGSGPETRAVVERFGVRHVRQEDVGFRKAKALNAAFRESAGRTVIFTDGDCVPPRDFVAVHADACPPDGFCVGGYVPLTREQSLTLDVTTDFADGLLAGHRLRLWSVHLQNLLYIALRRPRRPKVYGCNVSVGRDAFVSVNGFDENFDGFGKEDSDLRNRLVASGARPASVWNRCAVFHLHPSIDGRGEGRSEVKTRAEEYYRRANVPARCANGLVKG